MPETPTSAPETTEPKAAPKLLLAVGLVSAATIVLELLVTRFFSALFFYHYSFFAISIVMTGLTFGAIIARSIFPRQMTTDRAHGILAWLCVLFALLTALATLFFTWFSPFVTKASPAAWKVAVLAVAYLPGLVCSGAFLAGCFSWKRQDIGRVYSVDLLFAGAAVAGAIYLMRVWHGPVAAFVPALLGGAGAACLAVTARQWIGTAVATVLIAVPVAVAPFTERPLLTLPAAFAANIDGDVLPITHERWNEHSRILVTGGPEEPFHFLYIDRDAMTLIPRLEPRTGPGTETLPAWAFRDVLAFPYLLGRDVDRVAVIGVGGGRDLVSAVAGGARHVDGYELNSIFVDLLNNEFLEYSGGLVNWPEINLIHNEGRVGITTSGKTYDVIIASMVDTWAATANGGLVLSENSIYTVEAWTKFLAQLSPHGVLSMTRWFLPAEPAELQRLAVVAAEALHRAGIEDARRHVLVFSVATEEQVINSPSHASLVATLAISLTPFTDEEISRAAGLIAEAGIPHSVLYPSTSDLARLGPLLDPATRAQTIRDSPFHIAATTDSNPYFFLLVRPFDIPRLLQGGQGWIREITYNGVRVLVVMTVLTLAFTAAILLLTWRLKAPGLARGQMWALRFYFVGIGLGYMLVQLGLLQRLIVVLGHPVYAFSVILFTMLLASGVGSFVSNRLDVRRFPIVWMLVVAGIALVILAFPVFEVMDNISSVPMRIIASGVIPAVMGLLLGFCLPLGVRFAEPHGDVVVQRLWAINGAASITGSCLAAFIGVAFGSLGVLVAALACYALVGLLGVVLVRSTRTPTTA